MTSTFIRKINNNRRIQIDKQVFEKLGLQDGDYCKIQIEKIESGSPNNG